MKYRAEIDGLRALAVVPVILFHTGFEQFGGGFVGVDVFFVISGYLITTLILADLRTGRFSLLDFYERRARRILPALLVVVLACIPFARMWLVPEDYVDFSRSVAAVATFSSNILFWRESGYFDTAAELKPLLHTWSLAVEEQYYIFFPLLLMFLWRFGRATVIAAILLIFLASFAVAEWGASHSPAGAFFLLPPRAWELLVGAGCAFFLIDRTPELRNPAARQAGLAGVAMILAAVVLYDAETPFPGKFALLPCIGTALVILFARQGTLAGKILAHPSLVGIGLVSYSAYLWHQPLIVFRRYTTFELTALDRLALLVLTFVLAYLSWRFVERPFRNRAFLGRPQVLGASACALVALFALGFHGHLRQGYPDRGVTLSDVSLAGYVADNRALREESWRPLRELSGSSTYSTDANAFDRTHWFDARENRIKLLLAGNSHSKDLFNALSASRRTREHFAIARYGIQVRRIPGNSAFFDSPNYRSSDIVMLVSRYTAEDYRSLEDVVQAVLNDGKLVAIVRNTPEFPAYRGGLMTLADKTVHEAYAMGEQEPGRIVKISDAAHFASLSAGRDRGHARGDAKIDEILARFPEVVVLDRGDYICDPTTGQCHSLDEALNKFYYDYGHNTLEGAAHFGRRMDRVDWMKPVLERHEHGKMAAARRGDVQ